MQFLGSVEVPCHQGNGILCAAMQKVSLDAGPHGLWTPTSTEGRRALGAAPRPDSQAWAELFAITSGSLGVFSGSPSFPLTSPALLPENQHRLPQNLLEPSTGWVTDWGGGCGSTRSPAGPVMQWEGAEQPAPEHPPLAHGRTRSEEVGARRLRSWLRERGEAARVARGGWLVLRPRDGQDPGRSLQDACQGPSNVSRML